MFKIIHRYGDLVIFCYFSELWVISEKLRLYSFSFCEKNARSLPNLLVLKLVHTLINK